MSLRVRGQETFVDIIVEGFGALGGSFTKVQDFTHTPRIEQTEENYLGETFTDLDQQVNGHDFSFNIHETDGTPYLFLQQILAREENHVAPPAITVQVTTVYREPGTPATSLLFSDVVLKIDTNGSGGRTEYKTLAFTGKAKRLTIL